MLNLEEQVGRVWNPDIRPLVTEAYRCYATGAARACIILTWVAVCADVIEKASRLAEEGDGAVKALVNKIEAARREGLSSVIRMQEIERDLLNRATELELIDSIDKRELERLREDRHLCAHPSLRSLGEFYEPRLEYARAHLATALEVVLTHPPKQGQKAEDRFREHLIDPSFAENSAYLAHAFFDSVKSAAKQRIVNLAVKHAMLELPAPPGPKSPDATTLADRAAICVKAFAERDRGIVWDAVKKNIERLRGLSGEIQFRTLGRLGDLDVFWDMIDELTLSRFGDLINAIDLPGRRSLGRGDAAVLSLVAVDEVRGRFRVLEEKFAALVYWNRAAVIARRPSPYFASFVPQLLEEVRDYRVAESNTAQAVIPCGRFLTAEQLKEVLKHWAANSICWHAGEMPALSVDFFVATAHLRPGDEQIWREFIKAVRSHREADDDWYRYTKLEAEVNAYWGPPRPDKS